MPARKTLRAPSSVHLVAYQDRHELTDAALAELLCHDISTVRAWLRTDNPPAWTVPYITALIGLENSSVPEHFVVTALTDEASELIQSFLKALGDDAVKWTTL